MQNALGTIQKENIVLKINNIEFCKTEIDFSEFKIFLNDIKSNEQKLTAITQCTKLKTALKSIDFCDSLDFSDNPFHYVIHKYEIGTT